MVCLFVRCKWSMRKEQLKMLKGWQLTCARLFKFVERNLEVFLIFRPIFVRIQANDLISVSIARKDLHLEAICLSINEGTCRKRFINVRSLSVIRLFTGTLSSIGTVSKITTFNWIKNYSVAAAIEFTRRTLVRIRY